MILAMTMISFLTKGKKTNKNLQALSRGKTLRRQEVNLQFKQ